MRMVQLRNSKEVAGFYGDYRVRKDGSVWSCKGLKWRRLIGSLDKDSYRRVILCGDGKRTYARVCRLIIETFRGPCPAGMECSHKNGNNSDDRLANLQWKTHQENLADKLKHGTHQAGEKHGRAILTNRIVLEIRRLHKKGVSQAQISRMFMLKFVTVQAVVSRRNWRHI